MLFLYRDLAVLYYVIAFAGGFWLFWAQPLPGGEWVNVVAAFLFIVATALFFNKMVSIRVAKLTKIRMQDLRTRDFLAEVNKLDDGKPRSVRHLFARSYRIAALTDLGEYREAERILGNQMPEGKGQKVLPLQISWLNGKAVCLIDRGSFREAEQAITAAESLIGQVRNPNQRALFTRSFESARQLLRLREGDLRGQEEFWMNHYRCAGSPLESLMGTYHLAEVYDRLGRTEERDVCLKYVAETKGDPYVIRRAREILARAEAESEQPGQAAPTKTEGREQPRD